MIKVYNMDVMDGLKRLPSESVDCCITSPPYWGLRDYGTAKWEGGSAECDHVDFSMLGGQGDASNRGMEKRIFQSM